MYSASIIVTLLSDTASTSAREIHFGSATSTSINSSLGSATINLPSTMHSGTAAKTYIVITQLDTAESSRAKLSFSYSVAANCQTATIYFRDVTGSISNSTSLSFSYIVIQDKS